MQMPEPMLSSYSTAQIVRQSELNCEEAPQRHGVDWHEALAKTKAISQRHRQ